MDELLKILTADEKKIEILTARYNAFKKNIANETSVETETRKQLSVLISAMKKSNAVIVNHYLGEHKLEMAEIDKIVSSHEN